MNPGDHPRPLQAREIKGFGSLSKNNGTVLSGPDWPPGWHRGDTNFPNHPLSSPTSLQLEPLLAPYLQLIEEREQNEAHSRLLDPRDRLKLADLDLSAPDSAILKFCEDKAAFCHLVASSCGNSANIVEKLTSLLQRYRIQPPSPSNENPYSIINRLTDPVWWRRQVNRIRAQAIEAVARDLGMVRKQSTPYSSVISKNRRAREKERHDEYFSKREIVASDGTRLNLSDVRAASLANPAIRRAELMTRVKGFELVAEQLRHVAEFYTITCPSRMHAYNANNKSNTKYDGTTPREANDYLNHVWQLIRASLDRKKCYPYGFRVAEPNHDGTPHWHLLLFMPANEAALVRRIIRRYALLSDPTERGAAEHRFKAIEIDPSKGSACQYIAKYIAKNIDGHALGNDITGVKSSIAAEHIETWASTWRIRQFQQIGGPSVGLWRELRRLKEKNSDSIEPFREAADSANWAAFTLLMGGPRMKRCDRPLQPLRESTHRIDTVTGEIIELGLTRYGEKPAPRTIGVSTTTESVITRSMIWRIEMRLEDCQAHAHRAAAQSTWTSDNNCTQANTNAKH